MKILKALLTCCPLFKNGRYYTESNGNGIELNPGDIIANSQTIYIFNSNNCFSNESSFYINIENEGIKIPNFFTPNNDGKNDLWEKEDIQNKIARISVFDRYGKLIKILSDNDTSWNGILNGTFLPSDTYWYIIELKNKSTIKGYFALVR